jgi:hypothetical protein
VAVAALPVAVGLLALAAAARAVVWSGLDHAVAGRLSHLYAEALSTWCLAAVATHVLALGLAGEAALGSMIVPVLIGVAALLLRPALVGATPVAAGAEPPRAAARETPGSASQSAVDVASRPAAPAPPPAPTAAPAPPIAGAPAESLWADGKDDGAARTGLWSRA